MTLQEIQYKAQSIIHKWRDDDSAPYIEFVEELAHMIVPEPSDDLEEAADEYEERVIEETKCHHNALLTYAKGYEDALLLIPGAFIDGAKWQAEQFEKNRLIACSNQTKEEYDRETDFALGIIKKEHRQPTFSDAINYGMRLQKEQDDKELSDLLTIAHLQGAEQMKEKMQKDGNVILTEEDFDAEKEKSMEWGYNLCKEQMMKGAVAVEVVGDKRDLRLIDSTQRCLFNAKRGDWLKIIIIKEDEV